MPVARLAVLVLASAVAVGADDPPAIAIGGGVSHLAHRASREIVDEGGHDDLRDTYGYCAYIGVSAPQRAIIGFPWLDFVGTRNRGNGARIDSLGVLYVERAPIGQSLYLGGGVGSFYDAVHLPDGAGGTLSDHDWRIGGKALIGFAYGSGPFIELSYQYSGATHHVETSSANLMVGLRF